MLVNDKHSSLYCQIIQKRKKSFIALAPGNNFSSIYQDILLVLWQNKLERLWLTNIFFNLLAALEGKKLVCL